MQGQGDSKEEEEGESWRRICDNKRASVLQLSI